MALGFASVRGSAIPVILEIILRIAENADDLEKPADVANDNFEITIVPETVL